MANLTLRGGIGARVDAELEVKRSRFVCRLVRVDTEDAARAVIAGARSDHPSARHHCSAFVLGPASAPGQVRRSNDDGEPSGTAGRPMLDALIGRELMDCAAVVSRYFGGTLLGAGGLTRAYSEVVLTAIDLAVAHTALVSRVHRTLYSIELPHADAGRVESELRQRDVVVLGTDYGQCATLSIAGGPELHNIVSLVTAGEATVHAAGEEWIDSELLS